MENKTALKLFQQQQRTHWDDEQKKWYFSIVDVSSHLRLGGRPFSISNYSSYTTLNPILSERWFSGTGRPNTLRAVVCPGNSQFPPCTQAA